MQSLLGLKFLTSKSKRKELPQLQAKPEEKASVSGNGKQKISDKRNLEEGEIEALVYACPSDPLETITELSEERDLDRRSAANKKTKSSSRSKVKKGPTHTPLTRKNFAAVKNVWQDETFTNNESLPAMDRAYKHFKRLYPEYLDTLTVDEIRATEYSSLDESGHVCLDYSGYGLFSKWQETWQKVSASFGLSYISMNLPTHALYGGADEGTAEHDIKKMVLEFLNIQESEYAMVFTASRGSAFKLLGESYPFHLNKKLLSVYDYESDAITRLEEVAKKKGAEIMSARFRWPSQRLWATDLKKKLFEKKKNKREPGKGLFVFPVQSRVTGAKYSYQWMSQAQENGWDILLDASALGPNAMGSLGLCVFRPDFIVSSFFKVYGSDPTGFGCLLIKRSAIQRLQSSSVARGVGMVRLVSLTSLPRRPLKGGDVREVEFVTAGSSRFTEKRQTDFSGPLFSFPDRACMAGGYPSTSEMLLPASGKQGRIGPGQFSTSLQSMRHGMSRQEGSSAESRIVENNSPACSLPSRKMGHAQVCTSFSTSPSKQHEVRGHESVSPNFRMPANDSSTYGRFGRIGHGEVSTSSSTSTSKQHIVRGHEVSSSNSRMLINDSPAYSVSSEPQQKRSSVLDGIKDIHHLHETELELVYDSPQRPDAEEEYEMSSTESRSSTGFDSSRRNEGRLTRFLHQSQPSYVSSSAIISDDQQDDPSSLAYSEDISSAFFFDDDDYEDISIPSSTKEEDESHGDTSFVERKEPEIECRGLHHAHKLGLIATNIRLRCLINWLIASMLKLYHPGSPTSHRLVQIYGPKVDYDRGASVAFNLTDWKGNLLQPLLVQRLADRSNISLGVTTLNHIHLPKNSAKWPSYLEHINSNSVSRGHTGEARFGDKSSSFDVITVALCFLSNFEDVYKFWRFLANFLDADFVSKEVWRYRSLNQATIMLGVEEPRKS
ncbi:hypothetical protein GOP47_0004793 [Adiantum capillus-veneris]|uniref:Molybdenum cofactor sulfurase n=1 Tax=Adiantum capillus-veneris TaxID=13818 RepID=A0A9D4ZKY9_ADICA|nr:hypothetical protein GOP47_0004793 [Adiantum capillus-veneris]